MATIKQKKEEREYLNHDSCSDGVDNDGDGDTDMDDAECIAFWDNSNNKKLNYTPYPYPHPLIFDLAAPENLRIVGSQ